MKKLLAKDYLNNERQVYVAFYESYQSVNSEIHTHDFFEIFLMIEGEIIHMVNGKKEMLTEGNIVLLRPRDEHGFFPSQNSKCKHINLAFSATALYTLCDYFDINIETHFLFNNNSPSNIRLPYHQLQFIMQKVNPIKKAFLTNESYAINFEFKKLLYDLFVFFLDHKESKIDNSKIPSWMTSLVKEMYSSQNFAIGVSKMVELSGVSKEHLSRSFKTHYKTTPVYFIKQLRLNYAMNQLLYSNTNISDIAIDCGYESLSHFYKIFRAHTKSSPAKYRANNQRYFLT